MHCSCFCYFQRFHQAHSIELHLEGVKLMAAIAGEIEGIGETDLFDDIQYYIMFL